MKNVLTLTLIAGTRACPNKCPICISKMTPFHGISFDKTQLNVETLHKSIQFALNHNAQNILITGKGEPTLHPSQISHYLAELKGKPFDKRELQTEGSNISKNEMTPFLETWKYLDLDFIAISIYHFDSAMNQKMFGNEEGYCIETLIRKLHNIGYRVRLSCVMAEGYIDSVEKVKQLINFAKYNNVMQLSLRTVDVPVISLNDETKNFSEQYRLSEEKHSDIVNFVRSGLLCDTLPHGAEVWELEGQNVCMTTGLTNDAGKEDIRQLVFFPQGILTSSWVTVKGSRIF